jgi:hypothetical protein
MARFLIVLGLVILAVGLGWPYLSRLGLGRLPGDIVIERGHVTFYFPLMTCLLVSVLFSLVLWVANPLKRRSDHRAEGRWARALLPEEAARARFAPDEVMRPSIMPCRCAAALSMSGCLYWPARLSAASTPQRWTF